MRVPPPPPSPLRPITVVIPDNPPDPPPCPDCPEPEPGGNCEILGLFWYAPDMSGDFEEAQNAYAEISGSDPDYTYEARHEFSGTDPADIWVTEIGYCDSQPWAAHAVLRGYCEAMGEVEWVAGWSNTEDNPDWYPDVILTPAGTAVVIFNSGAGSGVEEGGVFVLSAIVDGETYGPITFETKDCG